MSGAIEELTAALKANTAALEKMMEMSGGKAAASSSSSSGKSTAAKSSGGKAASGGKKATPAKKKGPTLDQVSEAFTEYLGVKDKDVRKERIGEVKSILEYFGVGKATEIEEENWAEALGYLKQYEDGEVPDFDGGEEEEEDEDDDGALV
jgi:hypothetical protein